MDAKPERLTEKKEVSRHTLDKALQPTPAETPAAVKLHQESHPVVVPAAAGSPPVEEDQVHLAVATGTANYRESWNLGCSSLHKEKARALWTNSTAPVIPFHAQGPPQQLQQQLQQQQQLQRPLGEPVRGAVLLPSTRRRQQQQRVQCNPCSGGNPFDSCCEGPPGVLKGPPKSGIVLPPLKQRQRQNSRGPCARRRGFSGGASSLVGVPSGGITMSASAASLLPALKTGAAAAASSSRLMGSASAVDLSVIGRSLGTPPGPSTRPLLAYRTPSYGVYSHPPGKTALAPARYQQPSVSISADDRGRCGATARSSSSSGGRVFSRTRRSCSPIKERSPLGAFSSRERTSSGNGRPVSGGLLCRHNTADTLSLESRVNVSSAEVPEGTTLRAKEHWTHPRPQSSSTMHASLYPQANPPHLATTCLKELPSAARPTAEGGIAFAGEPVQGNGIWQCSNTRRHAPNAQQDALTRVAGLVSPSHGVYVHTYSQPSRAGPVGTVLQLNHSFVQQQQQQRHPSPVAYTPASPAAAAADYGGCFQAPVNVCSPIQYSFVSPTSRKTPTLSTVSVGRGSPLRRPISGDIVGAQCGFGILSPMCYSNPPIKSPGSSNRSSSKMHSIQRQRHEEDVRSGYMRGLERF